jgi:hypothetical protein
MRSFRRGTSVFLALLLAGSLAACGDDDDDAGGGGATETTEVATGADAVDVVMTDYAYSISGNLKPGGTIRLSNNGKEFHMMALGRLKEGKTLGDLTTILQQFASGPPEGEGTSTTTGAGGATTTTAAGGVTTTTASGGSTTTAAGGSTTTAESGVSTTRPAEGATGGEEEEDPTLEVIDEVGMPGTFQGPGQRAEITVPDFGEGTYAMICFIPTEGGGPPHFAQGMIGQLTVAGEQAAEPTADATFRIESGKAITGPSSLQAGRRVLKFEAVGDGADQLEPGMAKLNQGATVADINQAFETLFMTESLPTNAAAQVPGQLVASLFDFGEARSVYVATDLSAGTYGVVGNDTDPEDVPLDPVEKTTFTVT